MNRYTIQPKNPACQSVVVEADGYEWGPERAPDRVQFHRNGEVLVQGEEGLWVFVAEFAVDWVAGIVLETETAKVD